jgi:hypothetical protein
MEKQKAVMRMVSVGGGGQGYRQARMDEAEEEASVVLDISSSRLVQTQQ